MFGKSKIKKNEIRVEHYEGIDNWYQNCPCILEIKEDCLEFRKAIETNTITLNKDKIKMIDFISENDFMMKYHNTTAPKREIPISFLIIHYLSKENISKYIAFWVTTFEARKCMDLKYNFAKLNTISDNIEL